MPEGYWVYMLAGQRNGTLYAGITNDLSRRVYEHKVGVVPGFSSKYGVKTLVWFEFQDSIVEAIAR